MSGTERIVIARGRTAEVLAWQDGQVLKLFYDWMPADGIAQEIHAARLVSATDLPTPKLLGQLSYNGRSGLIYERVTGQPFLGLLASRPWMCVQYARQFAELHAAIHRLRGDGLPPLKPGLENTILSVKAIPPDLLAAALDRLSWLPEGEMLCHLDFHAEQVLMTANGLVVLDWMTARTGAPAADVARSVVVTRFGPVLDASWPMRLLANLLRGIFLRTYLKRYIELNPILSIEEIDAWLLPVALARLAEGITGEKEKLLAFLHRSQRRDNRLG